MPGRVYEKGDVSVGVRSSGITLCGERQWRLIEPIRMGVCRA